MTSIYGGWRAFHVITAMRPASPGEVCTAAFLIGLPLIMFVLILFVAAQRLEYNRLSGSYQGRIDQLQRRLNAQEDLLYLITNNDPESIMIFDNDNRFWFVNVSAAQQIGCDAKDIIGKTPTRVIDYERAGMVEKRLGDVRRSGRPLEALDQKIDANGQVRFLQARFEKIPPLGDFTGGVMVRSENVTGLIVERERRETMLRQLIATLVAVVDRRDPFAAGHSARVGQLSRAIAEELVLSEEDIETAEIAGSLMNFGKVLVPRAILTKTGALSADELRTVHDSILASADILSIINFPGPVVPTLRQVLERVDGTGVPKGLKGDDILMTARIVTVTNAFIALLSDRAHRPSLDLKGSIQRIQDGADTLFDRRVVTALAHYMENHSARLDWLLQLPGVRG